MAKKEITINVPMEEVWQMIIEKYKVKNEVDCKPIIKTEWIGDQRDGHDQHTLVSLQIKYEE